MRSYCAECGTFALLNSWSWCTSCVSTYYAPEPQVPAISFPVPSASAFTVRLP